METATTKSLSEKEAIAKFQALVNEVSICMFTTIDDEHRIMSRPMLTVNIDDDGNAWFFTNEYSEKINETSKDNTVNLIYSHPTKNIYIHVTGSCRVIIDRKKMEELWNSHMKSWFPDGLDDPKICLLKVTTENAYFWNNESSKMNHFLSMISSIATGDQYKETEKGKLDLAAKQPEM